jgi:hypothetical protein
VSTQSSVWCVVNSDGVQDKINEMIDAGMFFEATSLNDQLFAISDKINSLISERGGTVRLTTYSRQVLEMPVTVAEELPLILAGYKDVFTTKMSVGMGLTPNEAVMAAKKSVLTNQIELFDPEDSFIKEMKKSIEIGEEIFQPNLSDRTNPEPPKPTKDKKDFGNYVPGLDINQSIQADSQIVNGVLQQLMGPAQQMQQQAQQQMQQQAQQQPGSLLEAMSGDQKKTDKPVSHIDQKEQDKEEQKEAAPKKESEEKKPEEDKEDDSNNKIGKLLDNIQQKLPQIMDLKTKDPAAFKQSMSLVHKLLDMAKKDRIKKGEILTDELNKALRLKLPPGSVKGRKKKVVINGKAVWRSVASGQVADPTTGQAISVVSHNAAADDGKIGTVAEKK